MPGFTEGFDDERQQLLAELESCRYAVRLAAHGLTDEQARSAPSASALSVGGILKHLAGVERYWTDIVMRRQQPFAAGAPADYEAAFRMGPEETLDGLLAGYQAAGAATDEVARTLAVDHPVPIPTDVPWFPKDGRDWALRWVLLHLITETARHAGHADVVRETIDGAQWLPLMWAAEGLPASPWIQPWHPPEAPAA